MKKLVKPLRVLGREEGRAGLPLLPRGKRSTRHSPSNMPRFVTTHNFYQNLGKTMQGEISLRLACDNSCIFCYTAHYTQEPNTQQILFELMKAKEHGIEWINFTGGEPTLRPDFFEILEYANRLGFPVIYLKTHGRKFADMDFARRLVGKVTFVHISIHGSCAEVHDVVTRTPGSYEEAIQGIRNLISLGVPVVGMTVINRANMHDLARTFWSLHRMGVHSHSFAFPYPSGYALDLFEEGVPRHEECRPHVWSLLDAVRSTGKHSQVDNIPPCYLQGYEEFLNHLWFPALPASTHEWGPQCSACLYRPLCPGIPGAYIARRGWDEFRPQLHQADPPWERPNRLSLRRDLVPVASGRFLKQPHGGSLISRGLIPLTREGYRLMEAVLGKMTLGQVEERLGRRALSFVGSAHERNLVDFRPLETDGTPPVPELDEGAPLEHPLYRKHPPYPVVHLI